MDSWARRRTYNAFKEALGSGVRHHLQVTVEEFLLRTPFFLVRKEGFFIIGGRKLQKQRPKTTGLYENASVPRTLRGRALESYLHCTCNVSGNLFLSQLLRFYPMLVVSTSSEQ